MLTSLTCNSVCKRIVKQKPPDTVSCPFHITEVETGDWSIFFQKTYLAVQLTTSMFVFQSHIVTYSN